MLDLVSILVIDCIDPPKVFDPVFIPFFEPELSIEPALENRMIGKVYSRKKVVVP